MVTVLNNTVTVTKVAEFYYYRTTALMKGSMCDSFNNKKYVKKTCQVLILFEMSSISNPFQCACTSIPHNTCALIDI